MSKEPRKGTKTSKKPSVDVARGGAKGRGKSRAGRTDTPVWLQGKRPVFKFVALFAVFMGLFYVVDAIPYVKNTIFPAYLRLNAQASGGIISIFEDSTNVVGESISSPRYSLSIARGCDAVEPSALFVAGVLAFPAALLSKLPGLLIGTFCLMVINQIRIISLFYVGIYWPKAFHIMHVDVWQAVFIFLAILFWTLWALRAIRPVSAEPDAPVPTH